MGGGTLSAGGIFALGLESETCPRLLRRVVRLPGLDGRMQEDPVASMDDIVA